MSAQPSKRKRQLDEIDEASHAVRGARTTRFTRAAREFLWLDSRLAAAAKRALLPGRAGWPELALARAALRQADVLRASQGAPNPAMLLYRAAARMLVRAHLARLEVTTERLETSNYWQTFASLPKSSTLTARMSEEQLELAEVSLSEHGESLLAQMPRERAEQAARTLREIARFLATPLAEEAALAARVVLSRWLRISSALALASALAFFAVIQHRPNLALHRPVSVLNVDPEYANTQRLVDGNLTNLGFHATKAPHVATIDLGQARRISRVIVYNRTDCCEERAVPLVVELGELDKFQRVAERKSVFHVWRADFPPVVARYVRLTSANSAPFHLSEVEVY